MRARGLVLVIVMIAMVTASLVAGGLVQSQEARTHRVAEQRLAEDAAERLRVTLGQTLTGLQGVQGLFDASEALTEQELRTFARGPLGQPALTALSFTARVAAADRAAFERRSGRPISEIGPGGDRRRAAPRAEYFVITYIAPPPASTVGYGFDTGSDPVRAEAILAARDEGAARMSRPVALLGDEGQGVLIYQPIYTGGGVPASVGERRARLVGLAVGVYRTKVLIETAATRLPAGARMVVQDAGARLYGTGSPTGSETRLRIAGRDWRVAVSAAPAGVAWSAGLTLAAGLALTLAVGLLLAQAARRQRYTEQQVALRMAERDQAHAARRESEERFGRLVDSAGDAIVIADAGGSIVGWNAAATRMFGYTEDEAIGRSLSDLMPEHLRGAHRAGLARVAAGAPSRVQGRPVELTGLRRDGSEFPLELTLASWQGADGPYFSGIVRDVSDRRQAQDALRASEEDYRLLAENSTDLVVRMSPEGVLRYVSPASRQLIGRDPETMVGRNVREILADPDELPALDDRLQAASQAREPYRSLARIRHAGDGRWIWLESAVRPVLDPHGREVVEIQSAVRDVTERVEAQDELRRQRDERAALLGALKDGMIVLGPDGTLREVNDALCRMLGSAREHLVGMRSPLPFWPPDQLDRITTLMAQAMASREGGEFETELATAAGGRLSVIVTLAAVRDEASGEHTAYIATVKDVGARRAAQEALRHSNRFLEATLESLSDGVVACGADGSLALFNRATREFHGLGAEPLPPERWAERFSLYRADGETLLPVEEIPLARALRGEEVHEAAMVIAPRDSPPRLILASGRPIRDTDGTALGAVVAMQDVTARRRAEDALRREHDFSRSLIGSLQDGLAATDRDGLITEVNERFCELTGFARDELIGQGAPYPHWPADQEEQLTGYAARLRDEEHAEIDVSLRRKDGSRFPVIVTGSLLRDEQGRAAGRVVTVKDVSERHELERMKNEFLATASHELRTPLTSVLGYLQLVLDGSAGPVEADQRRLLGVAERRAQHLAALVGDIHTLARADAGRLRLERRPLDLRELAADAIEGTWAEASQRGLQLRYSSPDEPLVVDADPLRLGQVLDNLLSNALKFTPPGGEVTLRLEQSAGTCVIEVADTGIGIPATEQTAIFERFVRAPAAAELTIQGTGLGLAIAQTVVQAHGGAIGVESHEGVGTTFTVTLPCLTGAEGSVIAGRASDREPVRD